MIKMILCSDVNGAIGYKNNLIFNIKGDMEFFKEKTMNKKVVMGYNTWLSLPRKPLPKRDNYILYEGNDIEETENIHVLKSINEIVELSKDDEVFIIGGAMVYNQMIELDLVDEVYLTLVSGNHDADTFVDLFEMGKKLKNREFIKELECPLAKVNIYRFYN